MLNYVVYLARKQVPCPPFSNNINMTVHPCPLQVRGLGTCELVRRFPEFVNDSAPLVIPKSPLVEVNGGWWSFTTVPPRDLDDLRVLSLKNLKIICTVIQELAHLSKPWSHHQQSCQL